MYIEPCCAERQLGHLLREERGHVVAFQTNGDVTLEHWMKAVMLMSGDRPRTLTLSVPVFTDTMMRVVGRFMRQDWIKTLRLMTTEALAPENLQKLSGYVGCDTTALAERLELAADARMADGMMSFSGPEGTVIIQGIIYDIVTPGLTLYVGLFGRTDGAGVRSIMDTWNANFKARRYESFRHLKMSKSRNIKPSKCRNLEIPKSRKKRNNDTKSI